MKRIFFLLPLFILAGCSGLLPKGEEAPRLYLLNAPQAEENASAASIPVSLQIVIPQAAPGLDTERIALRQDNNRIDYFSHTKWSGNLAAMVQSLLVDSFDKRQALRAVGNDLMAMNKDMILLVEIRDFQAEYNGHTVPRIHIRLVAKMLRAATNDIVLTNTYDRFTPAKSNTMQDIVAAFDTTYQQASTTLIDDTLAALARQISAPQVKTKTN